MHARRRRSAPPWERGNVHPRHSVGRARRRWPRAYDGGTPEDGKMNPRYRRAFRSERIRDAIRRGRGMPGVDRLRKTPLRGGLVGLAVAGAAAPIAVNHYQQEWRTDPTHERMAMVPVMAQSVDEAAVREQWRVLEEESAEIDVREADIAENMERYAEYEVSRDLAEDIYDRAVEAEIDPDLAFGLVKAESNFKNSATSHVGAVGLTQLMPKTARWLEPGVRTSDLRNPEVNLRIGFRYLKQMLDKYDGDERLALLAYNRGPGTVDRVLKRGGNPDNGYVEMVTARLRS